jgi:hypothetical protein
MKSHFLTLAFSLVASLAIAHDIAEIGPNGGRILEFSKNGTMHGEITVQGDKFHIALLDKDMKPVKVDEQSLTASDANRENPRKLEVSKDDKGFTIPLVNVGEWLIVQFKLTPKAKAITARMEYNITKCGECKKPEWLCSCGSKNEKK